LTSFDQAALSRDGPAVRWTGQSGCGPGFGVPGLSVRTRSGLKSGWLTSIMVVAWGPKSKMDMVLIKGIESETQFRLA